MSPGRIVIGLGVVLVAAGAALLTAERLGLRLGRLPGDIVIDRGNTHFYFPLVTCLLVSALLSAIAWVFRKLS